MTEAFYPAAVANIMDEACESVLLALRFADEELCELASGRALPDCRGIVRRMRVRLPVPAVFAAIKVFDRVLLLARESRDSYDSDRPTRIPKVSGDVDFTVRNIWLRVAQRVDRRAAREFGWLEGRPWHAICQLLERLIQRAQDSFFGVSIV